MSVTAKQTPDQLLVDIADYVLSTQPFTELAYETAYYCLLDSIGCGLEALAYPACTKLLGPLVPGTTVQPGARVFATNYILDPVQAAFNIGTMIRWLDYNDTWLAAEWGHPSDNLGAILAVSDWLSRTRRSQGLAAIRIHDVLTALIKAYEIQGIIALENAFNQVGLDHVLLVKLASTAVSCQLLELTREQTINALSLVFTDGQALRSYRHAPNTGSRKSWAAGDASARGVRLALLAKVGEMGYPTALSTPQWGFEAVSFHGRPLSVTRKYSCYVMENILFKIAFPAEFHAQTAVECALRLHAQVKDRLTAISRIRIRTQRAALTIINKHGPLTNPADRDHCLQYMVAIALIYGRLTAADYEDNVAMDPLIDQLRAIMECVEDEQFSRDYLDPTKRSIANALLIEFKDGSSCEEVVCEYPLGHPRRRAEGIPLLLTKFKTNLARRYSLAQQQQILALINERKVFAQMSVDAFMDSLGAT